MSAKSLKYSHDKNCKGKQVDKPAEKHSVQQEVVKQIPETITVDFSDPYTRLHLIKQNRADKINSLVAQSLSKNRKM